MIPSFKFFIILLFIQLSFSTHSACDLSHNILEISYPRKINGIITMAHGLNQNPKMLHFLRNKFLNQGLITNLVSLEGHGDNAEASMRDVDTGCWEKQLSHAFNVSSNIKKEKNLTQHRFFAFSTGALVGTLLIAQADQSIDQLIFLSPALKTRFYTKTMKYLFFLPNRFIFTSLTKKEEKAVHGTSMKAYRELFRLQKKLESIKNTERINIPAKIFIHKKDELIDYRDIQSIIKKFNLNNWKLTTLEKNKPKGPKRFFHQITVPTHVDPNEWTNTIEKNIF